MNVGAVFGRELRTSARSPFTYHLRAIGVATLIGACLFFGLDHGFAPAMGSPLFGSLHRTLFFAIWLVIPILAADCVSRERREGTLGLLFLAGLKGSEIVLAKGLVHGVRAFTLLVSIIPVLAIPFLLGGLTWPELAVSFLINVTSLCLALGAGLAGSCLSRTRNRAMLNAMFLALLLFLLLVTVAGILTWMSIRRSGASAPFGLPQINLPIVSLGGLVFCTNASSVWTRYLFRLATPAQLTLNMVQIAIGGVTLLLLLLWAGGKHTSRVWREQTSAVPLAWLEKTFCRPVLWLDLFKRWMRRSLERNPIGWLERRTWSGRLVTWGWLAVVISLYSALLTDRGASRTYEAMQVLIAWLIMGSMALTSSGSFRRERETGVMELLLVSPLREHQIIRGRLAGLWMQFLPAFCLLFGVWLYLGSLFPHEVHGLAFGLFFSTFLSVPVIGLYFSLRSRTSFGAFLLTLALGIAGPLLLAELLNYISALSVAGAAQPWEFRDSHKAVVVQLVIGLVCWSALGRRLKARQFPLSAGASG